MTKTRDNMPPKQPKRKNDDGPERAKTTGEEDGIGCSSMSLVKKSFDFLAFGASSPSVPQAERIAL